MKNTTQFAISVLAAAVIASPAFAEPISNTASAQDGGVASEVVLRDNMWLNPALINTTPRQISVHSNNAGGVVTDVFGQRIGTHVRPGQTDLFWGMGMSGMLIGARIGIELDNASSLPANTFEGESIYSAPYDNGTDIITVKADDYNQYDNNRNLSLDVGAVMMGGALSVVGRLNSFASSDGTVTKGSVLTNSDAGGGGASTGTELRAVDKLDETSINSTVLSLEGRFYLSEATYIPGGFGFVSSSTVETLRDNKRDTDRDANADITLDESTLDETVDTTKTSTLVAGAGIGLIERSNNVTMRLEQLVTIARVSSSVEEKTVSDSFTDHLDSTNNTNGLIGVSQTTESSSFVLNLPIRATIEGAVSDKWTWRAGVEADLMSLLTSSSERTVNKANDDNDGYVKDFTRTLSDSSSLQSPDGVNTVFGLAYEPIENFTLDMVFNPSFLTGSFFNALATKFSVTYTF